MAPAVFETMSHGLSFAPYLHLTAMRSISMCEVIRTIRTGPWAACVSLLDPGSLSRSLRLPIS